MLRAVQGWVRFRRFCFDRQCLQRKVVLLSVITNLRYPFCSSWVVYNPPFMRNILIMDLHLYLQSNTEMSATIMELNMTKLHDQKWYQNNTSHGFGFLFLPIIKKKRIFEKKTNSTPINVSNQDKPSSEGLPHYYWSKLAPWQWLLGNIIIGWLMLSTWTNLQLLVSGL